MNLNLCGQTPQYKTTYWIDNPVKIRNSGPEVKLIILDNESKFIRAFISEISSLSLSKITGKKANLSRLLCLIGNNAENIFHGISREKVELISDYLIKSTFPSPCLIFHDQTSKPNPDFDILSELSVIIHERSSVKSAIISAALFKEEGENVFSCLPQELKQIIFKFFKDSVAKSANTNEFLSKKLAAHIKESLALFTHYLPPTPSEFVDVD